MIGSNCVPDFGAVQTPTALSSGEKLAVLNSENLANNTLSMAVQLHSQPSSPIVLAIYNKSGQTITLQASPDLVAADFAPVSSGGTAISVADSTVGEFSVSSGLYYAVKAGADITAGTVWLAR